MYFDMARVLITSTPLWLLNLRATSWANHHKTDYYAKSGLIDFCNSGSLFAAAALLSSAGAVTAPVQPCGTGVPLAAH